MRHTFKTTVPIERLDPDRDEFPVTVEYSHDPAGGDGWHEPRYEAEIEIISVLYDGQDVEDKLNKSVRYVL